MRRNLLWAVLLVLAVLAASAASPQEKAAGQNQSTIAKQWIAAWNSHDPDKLLPLFADDLVYEDVAFGEVSHGKTELRKFVVQEYESSPDLELKLVRADFHGDHGTIEWIFSGTDKGIFKTGRKFSVRGVSVIDLRGGKISRNLDFYDAATIMRQLGLLPA